MPPIALAALPLVIVVAVNLLMSLFVLPRMDASFLEKPEWGETRSRGRRRLGGGDRAFVAIVVLVRDQLSAPAGFARQHGCRR